MPEKRLKANKVIEGKECGWCGQALTLGADVALCDACQAVHHAKCWDGRRGCSGSECENAPLREIEEAKTDAKPLPPGRALCPSGHANLFRSVHAPLQEGDEIVLPGMNARVVEMGELGPRRVRFTFDRNVDSPSLFWTSEAWTGFQDARPPPLGFGIPLDP